MKKTFVMLLMCVYCLLIGMSQAVNAGVQSGNSLFTVKSNTITLRFAEQGQVSLIDRGSESRQLPSMVSLFNGKKADAPLSLVLKGIATKGDSLVASYIDPSAKISMKQTVSVRGDYIYCSASISNLGTSQAWIHAVAGVPLAFTDPSIGLWDGANAKDEFRGRNFNDSYQGTFPMVASYDLKKGFAIGARADQILSYIENTAQYDSSKKEISYGMKLVIDPGKTESAHYILFGFAPKYGYLDAIDSYYKSSPASFKPHKGVNIQGLCTSDADGVRDFERGSAAGNPVTFYETRRRFFGGVTWWYAAYKKSGQFWGEGDEQEWQRLLPKESALEAAYKGSAAVYHKDLRKQFHRATLKGIIPCYYVLDWCEQDLAERKYKQDILRWKDGTPVKVDGWVLGWADDYCMWWGGKFGEDSFAEFKAAATALDMDGFAMDCGEGNRDRPARPPYNDISSDPHKSYDEDGVFCDESIGIAEMCDKIHTIKKGDKVMSVYPNWSFAPPFYTAFRVDAVLCEPNFLKAMQEMNVHERIRYLLGEKPRQFLGTNLPRENLGKSVDWKNMTPEQIRDLYRNVWASALLACFKLAYYPSQDMQSGSPMMCKAMPVLDTLIKSGWQVVPAVKLNSPGLWTARYGKNLNSYIFIGNQKTSDEQIEAQVDNSYLGHGSYLFSRFDGTSLTNTIEGGRTLLAFPLKTKDYVVLKPLMNIQGLDSFSGTVSETGDIHSSEIRAQISADSTSPVRISVRVPSNCAVDSVKVGGLPIQFKAANGVASFSASLHGDTSVELKCRSLAYLSPEKSIQDFQFVKSDSSPACTVVVEDKADDWDTAAAQRLSDYFTFYFKEVKGLDVSLPVKKVSELTSADACRVRFVSAAQNEHYPAQGTVEVRGNDLIIKAPTSKARNALLFNVLRILDNRYPYYGKIMNTIQDEDTKQMREKAGLGAGGVMD